MQGYAAKGTAEKLMQECLAPGFYEDGVTHPIDRIHRKDVTPLQVYEKYLQPGSAGGVPFIIQGCQDDWPAMDKNSPQEWSLPKLRKRFPHQYFKCGEDDDGRRLRIKFKYFADYCEQQQDDSPVYLFQSGLQEETMSNTLLTDFTVPDVLPFDFLNLCGMDKKPPYRWWCIGPKRSGTTVHKDPLGTSAWNSVTTGVKRWILFEPYLAKRFVKGKDFKLKDEDDEAIDYFSLYLPRMKERIRKAKEELQGIQMRNNYSDEQFQKVVQDSQRQAQLAAQHKGKKN